MSGKLIVIEGLDGSGKSTQTELLQKKLAALSVDTKRIKLPDYDDPSSTLVRMYLGGEFGNDPSCVNVYAASSFYAVGPLCEVTAVIGKRTIFRVRSF